MSPGTARTRPAARTGHDRTALGAYGEACAARHLVAAGMVVLDRNWRCELGELDLVLRDGAALVVCEVKTRSSEAFGSPLEGVTPAKADRVRRLAERWVEERGLRVRELRVDLVGVLMDGLTVVALEHAVGVA